jgi:hypothetical protein
MTKKNILFMQNILLFIVIVILLIIALFMLSKNNVTNTNGILNTNDILNHKFNISSYANLGRPVEQNCNNGDVLFNAYAPPEKTDEIKVNSCRGGGVGVPINISTSAVDADYRQVGILKFNENGEDKILPLLGRPLFTSRDKWQYYTLSERNIKLPITHNGKNGTNEYGCDNIYSGDVVNVDGYGKNFKASIYENMHHKYLPFV